jgi:hypothetical protein
MAEEDQRSAIWRKSKIEESWRQRNRKLKAMA